MGVTESSCVLVCVVELQCRWCAATECAGVDWVLCVQMNSLAGLLKDQGKLDEAEPLYRETLAAKKETLGDKHPSTLASVSALPVLVL